jgi:fatty acid desaturase
MRVHLLFAAVLLACLATAAVTFFIHPLWPLGVVAAFATGGILFLNDRWDVQRDHRRAGVDMHFSQVQTLLLVGVAMANLMASAFALLL